MVKETLEKGFRGYTFYKVLFSIALLWLPLVFLSQFVFCAICAVSFRAIIYSVIKKFNSGFEDVADRGVLITGCDTGLGFDFAKHLDSLGFTVFAGCLNDNSQGAQKLRKECSKNIHVIQIDVTKENDVNRAQNFVSDHLPKRGLWAVVNNAGMNMNSEVELTTVSMYEKGFDLNLYGAIRVTKSFLPLLRRTKGRIVNITSVHGRLAINCYSNYAVAKHALETFSDSLRLEMQKFGVHVSIIEPGNFASGTSVLSDVAIERQRAELEEMWKAASIDVQRAYPKSYLEQRLRKPLSSQFNSKSDILKPVSDAVTHALRSTKPQTRYLVSGIGNKLKFIDEYTTLARARSILPTWIIDKYIAYWRQCDKIH